MSGYRGMWDGPRWAGISEAIKDTAHALNLSLWIEVDKGWIREHGRFTVEGEDKPVKQFINWFERAIAEYRKESE